MLQVPLALEYISREFEARLRPAAGKPLRPDLPSALTFTPEHKTAMQAVFGTDQPLQIKRLPGGGKQASYGLSIPGHRYATPDGFMEWKEATGKITTPQRGQSQVVMQWPGFEVSDKNGAMQLQGVRATALRRDALWGSKSSGDIERVAYTTANGTPAFSLHNIKATTNITTQGKAVNMRFEMGAQRLLAGEETIDGLHFGMRWRNLDRDTLTAIKTATESLQGKAQTDPAAMAGMLTTMKDAFQRLLLRGAAMEIDDFSLGYHGSKATIKADLSMPGATTADFDSMERTLAKMTGRVHIHVPLALLREVTKTVAERNVRAAGRPASSAPQMAKAMYEGVLGKAVANNMAVVEKDALVSTIELKGGNLYVNTRAFPIEQLLALLKTEKNQPVPPADTTPPVLVTMRERGIDVARLFAMNNDTNGLNDLCDRYSNGIGVAKNHAEAFNWCTKGSVTGVDSKIALAKLYLDGEGIPHDDAAALKLVQPLADTRQEKNAQYLMYRLYQEGRGVTKDQGKALAYLRQAAASGNSEAARTLQQIDRSFQPHSAEKDPRLVSMTVDGGFYESEYYRFDAAKRRHLSLTLGDFHAHDKMAPMQRICLTAISPSDQACLTLLRPTKTANELVVTSDVASTNRETYRNRKVIPAIFKVGEAIDVRVFARDGQVWFQVNDEKPIAQEANFPVELISLGCSTAICQFNFAADGVTTSN